VKGYLYSVHTSVLNDVPVLGCQGKDDGEALPDPQEAGGRRRTQPTGPATRGPRG
jgi:hypothetical protein